MAKIDVEMVPQPIRISIEVDYKVAKTLRQTIEGYIPELNSEHTYHEGAKVLRALADQLMKVC